MARLLFISHEATRTGAALQLRDMLRWMRDNAQHEITTVLLRGGDLVQDFEDLGSVIKVFAVPEAGVAERVARKVLRRPRGSALQWAHDRLSRMPRFDLVYANTTVTGVALGLMHGLAPRRIAHIHEMPTLIASMDPRAIAAVRQWADWLIVPSAMAAQGLCHSYGCDPARVSVLNAFVADPARADLAGPEARLHVRQAAGVPSDAWVLGVCGSAVFLKGTDLLPRLAAALPAAVDGRPVHLVHVGRFAHEQDRLFIERDARLLGVDQRLHFLGPTADPAALMCGFDVHLLPSREESFGLVVLEAAALGIPSVCFESASGAADFCREGAGVVVPYLNVEKMTTAACALLSDCEWRRLVGAAARAKWIRAHRIDTAMPYWLATLARELATAE